MKKQAPVQTAESPLDFCQGDGCSVRQGSATGAEGAAATAAAARACPNIITFKWKWIAWGERSARSVGYGTRAPTSRESPSGTTIANARLVRTRTAAARAKHLSHRLSAYLIAACDFRLCSGSGRIFRRLQTTTTTATTPPGRSLFFISSLP